MKKTKSKFKISVVNATNILNSMWTIRTKREILREVENNAQDEGASYLNIDVEYKEEKLNLYFKHDGRPFENVDEIINDFFCVGHSNKNVKVNEAVVGGKGVGNKYTLDCKLLRIISTYDGKRTIVTIINPAEQIESIVNKNIDGNIEYEVISELCEEENSVEIQIMDINYLDILEFAHEKLKEYICFFTIIASDKTVNKNFKVKLRGLKIKGKKGDDENYDISTMKEYETLEKNYLKETVRKIRENYKGEIVYFDSNGVGFEDKYQKEFDEITKLINVKTHDGKVCKIDFFIIQTINDEVKEFLNPLLRAGKLVGVPQSAFMGIYTAKRWMLIPQRIELPSYINGGHGYLQVFGVFNCNELWLEVGRNSLGGNSIDNLVEYNTKKVVKLLEKLIVEEKNQNEINKKLRQFNVLEQKDGKVYVEYTEKWRSAQELCVLYEKSMGNNAVDVSKQNLGYDVRSITPDGRYRYIEVKLLENSEYSLSNNEYSALCDNKNESFICKIVHVEGDIYMIKYNKFQDEKLERRVKEWEWIGNL